MDERRWHANGTECESPTDCVEDWQDETETETD